VQKSGVTGFRSEEHAAATRAKHRKIKKQQDHSITFHAIQQHSNKPYSFATTCTVMLVGVALFRLVLSVVVDNGRLFKRRSIALLKSIRNSVVEALTNLTVVNSANQQIQIYSNRR